MGAVNTPGATEVETEVVSILDLVAAAGGLSTDRADPEAVFIYRGSGQNSTQPTVLFLDLSRPDSLFLGERFEVRQDDIVYVGTADAVTLERFLALIFSPLNSIVSISEIN
jgi:polysaccharide export outer membrane protein